MTGRDENTKPSATRKWVRYALVASLGVNILVAGVVGGAILRAGPPERFRPGKDIAAFGLRPYARALDEGGRKSLREAVRAGRGDFHAGRQAMRTHMRDLAAALRADPYDEAAIEAELAKQARNVSANVAFGQRLLLTQIREMSDDARRALATRLLEPPRRR